VWVYVAIGKIGRHGKHGGSFVYCVSEFASDEMH
jgi:hypothetical protein